MDSFEWSKRRSPEDIERLMRAERDSWVARQELAAELRGFASSIFKRRSKRASGEVQSVPSDWLLEWWRSFSFALPHKTREQVFEPHFNELFEDFCELRHKRQSRGQQAWLRVAFTVRTAFMVLDCLRVMIGDRLSWVSKFWRRP